VQSRQELKFFSAALPPGQKLMRNRPLNTLTGPRTML
jgi:hypothetical protein